MGYALNLVDDQALSSAQERRRILGVLFAVLGAVQREVREFAECRVVFDQRALAHLADALNDCSRLDRERYPISWAKMQ